MIAAHGNRGVDGGGRRLVGARIRAQQGHAGAGAARLRLHAQGRGGAAAHRVVPNFGGEGRIHGAAAGDLQGLQFERSDRLRRLRWCCLPDRHLELLRCGQIVRIGGGDRDRGGALRARRNRHNASGRADAGHRLVRGSRLVGQRVAVGVGEIGSDGDFMGGRAGIKRRQCGNGALGRRRPVGHHLLAACHRQNENGRTQCSPTCDSVACVCRGCPSSVPGVPAPGP